MQASDLTPKQQTVELLRQADSILIVTGRDPNIDQVAGAYALQTVLTRLGKRSHTVITDRLPSAIEKLVDVSKIGTTLDAARDFIVSLNLDRVEVDKLKYDIVDNHLDITITPAAGNFTPEAASFQYGAYQFDLVIVLGVHKLIQIDKLLEQNPTLFDGLHLVNFDYHRVNEGYGSVNMVDTAATSVCEMLISVIESLSQGMIDAEIATALLAGIMSATNRFTTSSTTAKTMTVAAQLMSAGAKQQEVVRELYSTQSHPQPQKKPVEPAIKVAEAIDPATLEQLKAAAQAMQQPVIQEPVQESHNLEPGMTFTPVISPATQQ